MQTHTHKTHTHTQDTHIHKRIHKKENFSHLQWLGQTFKTNLQYYLQSQLTDRNASSECLPQTSLSDLPLSSVEYHESLYIT